MNTPTFAQFQFLTPDGKIMDVPGSRGILPLNEETPPALLREARRYCRETSNDFARVIIYKGGRTVACGRVG